MTINLSDNNPRVSYAVAEGVTQTSFTVSFEFFDNDDLNVYVDGTLKTITTHYTVSGGSGSTGTVTMSVTGATGGSTVVITRDIDLDRTTDFPSSGPFNIGSLNTELDRMIAITADLEDLASRGVKLADFDTAATLTLPLAADRINKVLAFNSAGDTLVSQELGVWKGDWAASTAYVERDLVRDSSDGSIYIVTSAHTSSGSTPLDTNTNSSKYSVIFDIGAMIAGTVTMTGDLSVQGNTTLGNAATDTVTITADVASNILPSADNTYDLGGTGAEWKDVYIDGVAYVDSIAMPTTTVTDILDEDTMSSNSATALATQQSVKAYVDSQIGSNNELSEVLGNGNTTGGNNIQLTTTDELQFRDTALKISSSADGQLDIDADTEVEITAPTVDINASTEVNISGDFTVDTNTLHVDSTNNRVGIANLSPSTALDVTGTVTATGGAFTGNVTFGDNNKAIFGTSSNLEIYGNGGYSYIDEVGANNLNIRTNGANIGIYDTANSQYMAQFTTGGGVELYHNGAQKFTTTPAGIDIGGTVLATGGAFTGDVTFGDNDKAIFGAGSDLQIYSDGANSIIHETDGTGNLIVKASNINLQNSGGTATLAQFIDGGKSSLRYNAVEKLATTSTGIDVTGTVTADGLTVDATSEISLVSDKTVTTPHTDYNLLLDNGSDTEFVIRLDSVFSGSIGSSHIKQISEGTNRGALVFATESGSGGVVPDRLKIDYNGDISFYEDTGTTAKFFWDASAEALALGTATSVSNNRLVIDQASGDGQNSGFYMQRNGGAGTSFKIDIDSSDVVNLRRSATTALAIDSSGNVGIGTSSPSANLHVSGSGARKIDITDTGGANTRISTASNNSYVGSTTNHPLLFITNDTERMRISSGGVVAIGNSSPKTWSGSSQGVLQIGNTGAIELFDTTDDPFSILSNLYRGTDLNYKYIENNEAARINFYQGDINFATAPVGTADTNATVTTRLTIENEGDVQIYPANNVKFSLSESGTGHAYLTVRAGYNTKDSQITFSNNTNSTTGSINYDHTSNFMKFSTNGSNERMRLTNDGNVLIGKTVIDNTTAGHRFADSGFMSHVRDGAAIAIYNRLTSDGDIIEFRKDGTTVGRISVTSSATAYNTSSDRRLKENIDDADDAGSLIDAIQVRKFDWKVDGSHQRYGMIAQELNDVVPEAVSVPENEEEMQSVDYSKLVPMLVKEIQSLRNRITELEAN